MEYRLSGLVAATYTPMDDAGRLNLVEVPSLVERLIGEGVRGLYVCGSTGEGASLTGGERRLVAEAFVEAAARRVSVIVQVGHNSVSEAAELAAHAQGIGADVVSAVAPSYFKVGTVELLVECMESIASAAPDLPFYYYHIPALSGATLDMARFLEQAGTRICNLAGIKYTCPTVHEYQICHEFDNGRFDIVWGADEMLLSALVAGARGAIGSTYNIAAPLYQRLVAAFDAGDLEEARRLQYQSVTMIRTIYQFPFHPAMKQIMKMLGTDCGRCRLPQPRLSDAEVAELHERLDQIGFFNWGRPRAD
ncbi:MAG: dihydrodipicolinate synthase family protein [Pirellulaceae bacterium]